MTPDTSSWLTFYLQRDPRGVLQVLGDDFGTYAQVPVEASLGEVSTTPGDVPGRELTSVYEAVSDAEHPGPQEFYQAMVEEQRLVLTLVPRSVIAWGLP